MPDQMTSEIAAKLRDLADECDALNTHFQVGKMQNAALRADNQRLRAALIYLESEARRFAEMYPPGSDGWNSFLIFADKIMMAVGLRGGESTVTDAMVDAALRVWSERRADVDASQAYLDRMRPDMRAAIEAAMAADPPGIGAPISGR